MSYAFQVVDSTDDAGEYASLALKLVGRPHLGYRGFNTVMTYARLACP